MTRDELTVMLGAHAKWLRGESGGVRANLRSANLRSADLSYADLSYADLSYADLRSADLSSANLRSADLSYADLSYANLRYANLRSANLRSAVGIEDTYLRRMQIVPEVGAFQCFKKVYDVATGASIVAHLEVPADAQRVGGVVGRKCRASAAVVLGFYGTDETPAVDVVAARSAHNREFVYRVGETVTPEEPYSASMIEECASGIHFFLTLAEAAEYSL